MKKFKLKMKFLVNFLVLLLCSSCMKVSVDNLQMKEIKVNYLISKPPGSDSIFCVAHFEREAFGLNSYYLATDDVLLCNDQTMIPDNGGYYYAYSKYDINEETSIVLMHHGFPLFVGKSKPDNDWKQVWLDSQ